MKYNINDWIELYKTKSATEIASDYDISTNTVIKYLRLSGIKMRNQSPVRMTYKKKVNSKYFEKIDSVEKAYFLGLLFADGNLYNNTITLSLKRCDRDILEKFKSSIEGEMSIYDYKNESILKFSDKVFKEFLLNQGISPNKSLTIKYPKIKKCFDRHFIRGYFDGDGCVSIHTDKRNGSRRGQVNICSGSKSFIEDLVDKLVAYTNIRKNKIRCPNGVYNVIDWGGLSDVEKIYEFLYKDTDLYLDRKKKTFDIVMDINKSKTKYKKK